MLEHSSQDRTRSHLQQLAGGDGELDDVRRNARRISACSDFGAAAIEGFQLPVIEGAPRNGHVVAAVAVLRFGERLDNLRRGQLVGDLREIERVAAGGIVPREGECADGVDKIACRRIDVQRRKRNRDGHESLQVNICVRWMEVKEKSRRVAGCDLESSTSSTSSTSLTSFTSSKRRVAAAGGKRTAAARGLLFAAHGGADEILDGVGGGIVPFFGKRAAARPA